MFPSTGSLDIAGTLWWALLCGTQKAHDAALEAFLGFRMHQERSQPKNLNIHSHHCAVGSWSICWPRFLQWVWSCWQRHHRHQLPHPRVTAKAELWWIGTMTQMTQKKKITRQELIFSPGRTVTFLEFLVESVTKNPRVLYLRNRQVLSL